MADSQQPKKQPAKKAVNPQPKSSDHQKVLEGSFSPAIVAALEGRTREIAREEIDAALKAIKQQLDDVVAQQRETIEKVRSMPPAERSQVKSKVDDATSQVRAAADDNNELVARQNAGEQVEPQEVKKSAERANQAQEAAGKVSGEVSRQLASLKEQSDRHQGILAVDHKGERPPSRIDEIVKRLDDHERRLGEHEGVIATAFAYARASVNSGRVWQQAAKVGLIAFVVTFLLYCLLVLITPVVWEWDNALGVPAVVAGLAAAIMFLRSGDTEADASSASYAEAARHSASRNRSQWQREERQENQREQSHEGGLSVLRRDDRDDNDRDDRQRGTSASAGAHASSR